MTGGGRKSGDTEVPHPKTQVAKNQKHRKEMQAFQNRFNWLQEKCKPEYHMCLFPSQPSETSGAVLSTQHFTGKQKEPNRRERKGTTNDVKSA